MTKRDRYDSLFQYFASARGPSWQLLKAQAIAESDLNPRAISPAGAEGLCQFMPATWREIMGDADPFNPEASIQAQTIYLHRLLDRYGDVAKALAAYNWGMGNVDRCHAQHGATWREHLPDETRAYLARIAELQRTL